MSADHPIKEVYNHEWEILTKVQKGRCTFMLAVHLTEQLGAQIIKAENHTVILEMPIEHMPSIAHFENLYRG